MAIFSLAMFRRREKEEKNYGAPSVKKCLQQKDSLFRLKKLINNSRRKFKRNTFLISVFICDKDFS